MVKSKKKEDHIKDLCETFANLPQHSLKLNPKKCAFRVTKGKLLGCLVSQEGIQANPDKVEANRNMQPPRTKREVQKLAGRIASLNCCISKSAEKSLHFFLMLKNGNLSWGPSQHEAFEGLKQYLENLVVLASPTLKADLLLYIASSESTVSASLVEERNIEGKVKQLPI